MRLEHQKDLLHYHTCLISRSGDWRGLKLPFCLVSRAARCFLTHGDWGNTLQNLAYHLWSLKIVVVKERSVSEPKSPDEDGCPCACVSGSAGYSQSKMVEAEDELTRDGIKMMYSKVEGFIGSKNTGIMKRTRCGGEQPTVAAWVSAAWELM
ncbi:hypothetical protein O3P69_005640 [Scylla paramamosain]|uniref:Uncharacterized protein n=1 Tax=Scylla paramamosain TaxID=85552 RepID=A0AAW0U6N2_SCYPA